MGHLIFTKLWDGEHLAGYKIRVCIDTKTNIGISGLLLGFLYENDAAVHYITVKEQISTKRGLVTKW